MNVIFNSRYGSRDRHLLSPWSTAHVTGQVGRVEGGWRWGAGDRRGEGGKGDVYLPLQGIQDLL